MLPPRRNGALMVKGQLPKVLMALSLLAPGSLLEAQAPSTPWIAAQEVGSPQYFAVRVSNLAEAVAWYTGVFGLDEVGGSEADDGTWEIMNLRNENLFVEIVRDDRAEEGERHRGFYKVGFFVSDVRIIADRIEAAGHERPRVLEFDRFGVRIVQLRDPDGNIVQLFSSSR